MDKEDNFMTSEQKDYISSAATEEKIKEASKRIKEGESVDEVCKSLGISRGTYYYNFRRIGGGLPVLVRKTKKIKIRSNTTLAKNLLFLMEKRGWNPNYLSTLAGIKKGTVHNILSGESERPNVYQVIALANVLGTTVEVLVNSNDIENIKENNVPIDGVIYYQSIQVAMNAYKERHRTLDLSDKKIRSVITKIGDVVYKYADKGNLTNPDITLARILVNGVNGNE